MNIENAGSLSAPQIDLAHEPPFALGPLLVEPALRRMTCGAEDTTVEPKVMQVLVALGRDPGKILSRDDLIDSCWDGRIVGDASVNRVMSLLRSAVRDLAGEVVTIETLPKVGYRVLVDPEFAGAAGDGADDADAGEPQTGRQGRRIAPLVLMAVALLVLAGASLWWFNRPNTDPLTVVMLPLQVGEGVDPIYASGMEGEIRAQLGRSLGMEVRAGESAGQLLAEGRTPAEIGTALDVDLVWQGELSNSASNVALNARLVDPENGADVWAENLLSAPDAAHYLPLRAVREMLLALRRPVAPDASGPEVASEDYALYLTALGLVKGRGFDERIAAVDILEQIVARNPDFADGLAGLAKANYLYPSTDQAIVDERRAIALEQAEAALALDPRSTDALKVSGMLLSDFPERLRRLQLATEIDPGDSEAWFWLGIVQREATPFGGDVLETVSRMVAVDPLWPASWRASALAIEHGNFTLARSLEERIIASAAKDAQRALAEARLVRMDGDLSEFMRLVRSVQPALTEAEQRWGYFSELRYTRFLLGLRSEEAQVVYPRDAFLEMLRNNELPSPAAFQEAGVMGTAFWEDGHIVTEATPMLLREGRQEELLRYYDAMFGHPQEFENWATDMGVPLQIVPVMSPYLALALQRVGRNAEAQQHIALAREYSGRWRDAGTVVVFSLLYELQLAAIEGDDIKAAQLVRQLPDHGWPLLMTHLDNQPVGLLFDDPLYDHVRELPEVQAVLDPIRAHIARERREALELGFE